MNLSDEQRGSSGISILWPNTDNQHFKEALQSAAKGGSPNNISPIIHYRGGGMSFLWMGDLEHDFMEEISNEIDLPKVNILFAPHHGRSSGSVPKTLLDQMKPDLIVIGSADSSHMTITQNRSGDLIFECNNNDIDIYCSNVARIEDLRKKSKDFRPFTINWLKSTLNPNYVFTLVA